MMSEVVATHSRGSEKTVNLVGRGKPIKIVLHGCNYPVRACTHGVITAM